MYKSVLFYFWCAMLESDVSCSLNICWFSSLSFCLYFFTFFSLIYNGFFASYVGEIILFVLRQSKLVSHMLVEADSLWRLHAVGNVSGG